MAPSGARDAAFPALVRPMLATAGALPTDDSAWAFEMKWDGVRAVTYVADGALRAVSRNDRDITGSYPELPALAAALAGHDVVLDGELVALDEGGRPSFGVLQQRMHVQHPPHALVAAVPVTYLVFDVLHLDASSTLALPYVRRRELLESLELSGPSWQTPAHFAGSGQQAEDASLTAGLEGVVAKRLGSVYRPGRRSADWVKIKHERTQDVVVIGWSAGEGRRTGTIGALLLGVHDASTGELRYAGQVGTGFSDATLADLLARLQPLARAKPAVDVPARDARNAVWVVPRLVGEVVFAEWTRDGRLRHPSWRGLRPDRPPEDVVAEP